MQIRHALRKKRTAVFVCYGTHFFYLPTRCTQAHLGSQTNNILLGSCSSLLLFAGLRAGLRAGLHILYVQCWVMQYFEISSKYINEFVHVLYAFIDDN